MVTPPVVKILPSTVYRNERVLPAEGDIIARVGDTVHPDTPIARVLLPSLPVNVPVAGALGIRPKDMAPYLTKQVGDRVQAGDIIARKKATLLQGKRECAAPIDGVLEYISYDQGHVTIRRPARPTVIWAEAEGKVTEIVPRKSVIIEAGAALIQGSLGMGEDANGQLRVLVSGPNERISPGRLDKSCRGQILVAGSIDDDEVLAEAQTLGAKGLILGGIKPLGHQSWLTLGRAFPLAVILTDGFGAAGMFPQAFDILRRNEGKKAWLRPLSLGKPEIAVLLPEGRAPDTRKPPSLAPGAMVRGVRSPFCGLAGTIVGLPKAPRTLESGVRAMVAEVETAEGKSIEVALANLELIG